MSFLIQKTSNKKRKSTPPKLSVIMSVYNGEKYLREAIQSILDQSFSDFEYIIINDGSTDCTAKILASFDDQRIKIITNQQNIGLTAALNKGLVLAKGEYIARMDADDVSLSFRFKKQIDILDNNSNVVLVSGNIDLINSEGKVWYKIRRNRHPGIVAWFLLFYNYLGGHSQVMFRRQLVSYLGGYSKEYRYSQDHDLWQRLSNEGDIVILPEVILLCRCHNESVSVKNKIAQRQNTLMISKRAISRLLREEIDLEEITELNAFWIGHFSDINNMRKINQLLRRIFSAFLENVNTRKASIDVSLSHELCMLTCRRFLTWAHILYLKSKIRLVFFAVWYGIKWYLLCFVMSISWI